MKRIFVVFVAAAAFLAAVAVVRLGTAPPPVERGTLQVSLDSPAELAASHVPVKPSAGTRPEPTTAGERLFPPPPAAKTVPVNKAERLAQIRESFRALAKADATGALRQAKQLVDETERETALLELVTQWRKGELTNPRERAQAIADFGLEAGLGFELAKDPQLALLWADELTEGPGRAALVARIAVAMVGSDPTAAFALSDRLDSSGHRGFMDAVFAGWAEKDTDAALQYADQLPEATERDAAVQAIRSVAPVGIGTQIGVKDGYAVIQGLLPGAPAELSGQLDPGDRILAIAQGDNAFVDTRGIPLKDLVDMIRGAPGTLVQLQVLPSEAAPDATPRTVSILRGQIKFKQ
jgi:hypothetical protein